MYFLSVSPCAPVITPCVSGVLDLLANGTVFPPPLPQHTHTHSSRPARFRQHRQPPQLHQHEQHQRRERGAGLHTLIQDDALKKSNDQRQRYKKCYFFSLSFQKNWLNLHTASWKCVKGRKDSVFSLKRRLLQFHLYVKMGFRVNRLALHSTSMYCTGKHTGDRCLDSGCFASPSPNCHMDCAAVQKISCCLGVFLPPVRKEISPSPRTILTRTPMESQTFSACTDYEAKAIYEQRWLSKVQPFPHFFSTPHTHKSEV